MCGIYGFVCQRKEINPEILPRMGFALAHRGPDDGDERITISDAGCVALGHKRLSIIDLSPAGRQPMPNEDKSIWLTLNGEIYNYQELRQELKSKGHRFRSHADSEVVVHLYEECGAQCLVKLKGMFAFALWDSKAKSLLLARDRIGKKPLHYCLTGDGLIFASEIKALLQHPSVSRDLDFKALSKYLSYEYVPAPDTIFRSIKKLEPGHYLIYSNHHSRVARYWDIPLQNNQTIRRSEEDCTEELRALLNLSVKRRLVADVPVGLFVSGGLDSGIVAAFAAKAKSDLDCFSIGFDDPSFDESAYSRTIAASLGIRHHLKTFTGRDMLQLLEQLPRLLDEPLADPSVFPLYLLSKFAAEHSKVVLSGDGGDELFAGYQTFQADKLMRYYGALPGFVKHSIRTISQHLPVSHDYLSADYKIKQFLKADSVPPEIRFFLWRGAFSPADQYALLAPDIRAELGEYDCYEDIARYIDESGLGRGVERLLYLCMKLYLQDNNLVTVDRASMANGLEVRCPLLDQDLVEFVSRLPARYKLKGFRAKYLLKKAAKGLLPETIIHRQKKGFGIPLAKWLCTDLKDFMLDHLNEARIRRHGIFDYAYIKRLMDEQFAKIKDHRELLWTLIVFQSWYEEYIDNPNRPNCRH
ncbi:MAG TPA: asparagine synthase (glutamine-hydrolyzing) [Candidatus Binatia bacterium]|nr:asparagine synthase (glutamine-hydrolyzing) [Candidatus Binatia bacterium]